MWGLNNVIKVNRHSMTDMIAAGADNYVPKQIAVMSSANRKASFVSDIIDSGHMQGAMGMMGIDTTAKRVAGQMSTAQIGRRYSSFRESSGLAAKEYDRLHGNYNQMMKIATEEGNSEAASFYKSAMSSAMTDKAKVQGASMLSYAQEAGSYAKRLGNWATREGTMMDRAKKTALVGGGYMAVNYAGRVASGGGLTYNNQGESDIAGIPFI